MIREISIPKVKKLGHCVLYIKLLFIVIDTCFAYNDPCYDPL